MNETPTRETMTQMILACAEEMGKDEAHIQLLAQQLDAMSLEDLKRVYEGVFQ